ncbi:Virulence-associated protein and related proteins [[Pasteurella] mairii]|uniref:Virulence-associated protein and related proteins n=1 Tax=[Pasteurella] mairii TaxID=757 RepID=A0A379B724_9PAST|nr:Virulence-associated protein and related proteins [[Pasteurella] mairii]
MYSKHYIFLFKSFLFPKNILRNRLLYKQIKPMPQYITFRPSGDRKMERIASLFKNGRSQAVRLPVDFEFNAQQIYIRKEANGDFGNALIIDNANDLCIHIIPYYLTCWCNFANCWDRFTEEYFFPDFFFFVLDST